MKCFCFTVDDNIRFLKEITENRYRSIFEHPYLSIYKRLHEELGLKVQLNLFYSLGNFDLSQMTDAYYSEWEQNSDWLKLSFHSELENVHPYASSDYDTVARDCENVNREIRRFASPAALATTTTIHYCSLTAAGLRAISDSGTVGLLGLFGTDLAPINSYGIGESLSKRLRDGEILKIGAISFASIDIVLNCFSIDEILAKLAAMSERPCIRVMIHEQYFYSDYSRFQPDFEEKLRSCFCALSEQGYKSALFEDLI